MGRSAYVRFSPVSDRTADIAGGPVRANTGSGGRRSFRGVPINDMGFELQHNAGRTQVADIRV